MHFRFLVLINKDRAPDSMGARDYVHHILVNDSSFIQHDDSRFASPMCDWFVIGGRWSGELTRAKLSQSKLELLDKEFDKKHGWWHGGKEGTTREDRSRQYNKMFRKYFPKFKNKKDWEIPGWRDQYEEYGYDDDAMILDKKLYDAFLKEYEGQELWPGTCEEIADLDCAGDIVTKELIGNKWLVVVDYHS